MKFDAIIFDLDGVICHTDDFHYLAWKAVADRYGIPFDRTVNERLRGVSRRDSLEILLENGGKTCSEKDKQRMAEEKNEIYRGFLAGMTPGDLSPDTRETLNALKARGVRLAIGSSSKNAGLILSRLGLGSFFDAAADGTEIRRSKPDPEVFLLAAEKLRVPPCRAAVVEDAAAGIEAAKRGGFYAIGIGSAAGCEASDGRIRRLSDLLSIVQGPLP